MSSWRDGDKSTGNSSRSASSWRKSRRAAARGDKQWKESSSRPSTGGRGLKVAGLFLLFLALVGILVWRMLHMPRSVPLISIASAAYEFPLPPLAFVEEDSDLLKDVLGAAHDNVALQVSEQRPRSGESFLQELTYQLQNAKPGGPAKNVIVVHFRAHGVVHSNGDPCLLFASSKLLDESTWLPVQQVFETAKQQTTDASLLFVIDAVAERTLWKAGVLHNQFTSRLNDLLAADTSGRVAVLHAADVGQVSYAAPELNGSVFSHYVARGLQGAADTNSDDEVTLQELHQFVSDRVNAFARSRRADSQRPVLIPHDRDLRVSHVATHRTGQAKPFQIATPSIRLDELWSRFAELHRAQAYSADPMAWAELEHRLVRLEAICLAGKAYASQLDLKEITVLIAELQAAVKTDPVMASSLAVAKRAVDPAELQSATDQINTWKASLGTDKPLPVPPLREPVASLAAWSEAVGGTSPETSPGALDRASELLTAAQTPRAIAYSEIKYLQLLGLVDAKGTTSTAIPSALECFQLAEEAAAPSDWRAHYWLRDIVGKSDRVHDGLLDSMLIGSPQARQVVEQSLTRLTGGEGSYQDAKDIAELLSRAFQLRDEAWATIPHLAAWIDSEAWLEGAGVQMDGQVRSNKFTPTLTNLVQATHELGDQIDRLPLELSSLGQAKRQLDQRMQAVQVGLSALLSEFDQQCSTLVQGETFKNDERTIRQIASVLKLPLLPNDDVTTRMALRNRLIEHRNSEYTEDSTTELKAIESDRQYVTWLTDQQEPHVLAALNRDYLDARSEGIATGAQIDAVPNNATDKDRRDRLLKLGTELRSRIANSRSAATKLGTNKYDGSPFECRVGLSKADRLLRATAPLVGERIWSKLDTEQDPIRRLRRFDQHAFYLWHGRRALQNWWGSGEERPYFAKSAEHQLAATAKYARLAPEGRPEIEHGASFHARLREDIVEQENIAARWKPAIRAENVSVTSSAVRHSVTTTSVPGMPAGSTAVYLSDDEGTIEVYGPEGQVYRRRAANVTTGETLNHILRDARHLSVGSVAAKTIFRGHQRQVSFDVDDPGQAIVVWNELAPNTPRITVKGDSREKSQIMFVLDCSGSMSAPYQGNMNRLQFAIQTLRDTVRKLDRNHYLGLILYGHRYPDGTGDVARRAAADVQVVYPIDEPNTAQCQNELFDELDGLRPTGATPLYLSIQKAIESFDARIGGVKAVVVLTDGDDKTIAEQPAQDVVDTWNQSRHKPRIDIVAIASQLNKLAELRAITDVQEDGRLHQNIDADDLANTLEELVGLRTFHVTNLQTGDQSDELPLGSTWTENNFSDWNLFDIRRNYRVQVGNATKDVVLEGGEHLDLVYNRRGARLEFEPYTRDSDEDRIPVPGSELYALSHYPWKLRNSLVFQVSIQQADTTIFSRRPRHVWAELQPSRFGANAPLIHAFDCDFKMDAPVPVVQFRVRNWPGSETAKMKLWFNYDEDLPNEQTIEVQKDRESSRDLKHATLRMVPNRRSDGITQLLVVEQHTDESTNFPLRIRLIPPAKKTEHRRFPRKREVHHLFECEDRNTLRLGISSKSHLARGWYETETFDVLIPNR